MGTRFARYELVERIGVGGMAEAFRALAIPADGSEPITVVVKRILPHLANDKSYRDMMIDEARIASMLDHPNVVGFIEFGKIEEQLFVALEYVDGVDAEQLLRSPRRDKRCAILLTLDILAALDHAHTRTRPDGTPLGIVHRDVSPANVLVSRDGVAKLTDFGIAKAEGRLSRTEVGIMKGNLMSSAPEQILGGEMDARADIYAAGILLHTLLIGKHPLAEMDMREMVLAHTEGTLPLPSDSDPSIDPELDVIVRAATARTAGHRVPNAAEFAATLRGYARRQKISLDSAPVRDWVASARAFASAAGDVAPTLAGANIAGLAAANVQEDLDIDEIRGALDARVESETEPSLMIEPLESMPASAIDIIDLTTEMLETVPDFEGIADLAPEELTPVTMPSPLELFPPLPASVAGAGSSTARAPAPAPRPAPSRPARAPSKPSSSPFTSLDDAISESLGRPESTPSGGYPAAVDGQSRATNNASRPRPTATAGFAKQTGELKGHKGSVSAIALLDGQVITGSHDRMLRVWDISTQKLATTLPGHTAAINSISVHAKSGRIASSGRDGHIRVWDARAMLPVELMRSHRGWVFSVAFSEDGETILSGGDDRAIRIWKGTTPTTIPAHLDAVSAVVILPGGGAASGSYDRTIKIWDLAARIPKSMIQGELDRIRVLVGDGRGRILAGDAAGRIRIYDTKTGEVFLRIDEHSDPVAAAAFSTDGKVAITGGFDGTIRAWDVSSKSGGRAIGVIDLGADNQVSAVALAPGGLVFGASGDSVRIWKTPLV